MRGTPPGLAPWSPEAVPLNECRGDESVAGAAPGKLEWDAAAPARLLRLEVDCSRDKGSGKSVEEVEARRLNVLANGERAEPVPVPVPVPAPRAGDSGGKPGDEAREEADEAAADGAWKEGKRPVPDGEPKGGECAALLAGGYSIARVRERRAMRAYDKAARRELRMLTLLLVDGAVCCATHSPCGCRSWFALKQPPHCCSRGTDHVIATSLSLFCFSTLRP